MVMLPVWTFLASHFERISTLLLHSTCSLTSNYPFCVAALQSDPRSLRANDVKSLSAIAVGIAFSKARTTSTYASGMTKNVTAAAALFGTCAEKYRNAGEALRWALGSLAQENYDYACMHVRAAHEYACACGTLFSRRKSPASAYPPATAKRADYLQRKGNHVG
ncbi:hypothetical protein GW17_00047414 [Ensete ventricosum]|nr:hypothetical protein GW17_00047414 [Ensete ventricosum]